MLYSDRIDVSEGVDLNKRIKRVQYLTLLVFLHKGFTFQPDVCNR